MSAVRVRFAPSPTGILHLGGLRTALFNFLFARKNEGKFILRIEDTDKKRYQPQAVQNILNTLRWAKITPDEGPEVGGRYGPYIQSERKNLYSEMVSHLLAKDCAYHCFCSTSRLEMLARAQRRRGETPGYDKKCRELSDTQVAEKLNNQEEHVIRFKLETGEAEFEDQIVGKIKCDIGKTESDPVILKSDGMPVYHLANVVDDHFMEISYVIRGIEWLPSLPKHLSIYRAFEWTPPSFAHVPLLLNQDRLKLSKRSPDYEKYELQTYVERGYLPETVLNWILRSGGGFSPSNPWRPGMSIQEMVEAFDVRSLMATSAELNWPSLDSCGKSHFDQLMFSVDGRKAILRELGNRYDNMTEYDDEDNKNIFERILVNRITCFADFDEFSYIWQKPDIDAVMKTIKSLCSDEDSVTTLRQVAKRLVENVDFDGNLKVVGVKKQIAMRVLRLSLIGLMEGPRVSDLLSSMPVGEAKKRLETIRTILEKSSTNSSINSV